MIPRKKLILLLDCFFVISVVLLLFLQIISYSLSHDEQQFIAPSQLLVSRGLLPYKDYPFLHMPYIIFFNEIALVIPGSDFFNIRIENMLFFFLTIAIIYVYTKNQLNNQGEWVSRLAGFFVAVTTFLAPTFINSTGWALNHALPMMTSLLATLIFLNQNNWSEKWMFAIAGGLVGISTCTRLSYATLIPAFLIGILLIPDGTKLFIRLNKTVWYLLGIFTSSIPSILLYVIAPNKFYYGNLVYIRLNAIYQGQQKFNNMLTLASKFTYFISEELHSPITIALYISWVFSLIFGISLIKDKDYNHAFKLLFTCILAAAMFATAFAPTPLWPKYFIAPLPFLAICLLFVVKIIHSKIAASSTHKSIVMALLTLLIFSSQYNSTSRKLQLLTNPSSWVPIQMHALGQEIKSSIGSGRVLTLGPIFPLEGGLDAYEIFATGPFAWRTSLNLSKGYRARYGVISPYELESYLSKNPPKAILTGIESNSNGFDQPDPTSLESPLIKYAHENNYRPINILYSRPTNTKLVIWMK